MAKRYKAHNSIISFIALAFLLYFVGLPIVIAVLTSYFGSIAEVITSVVDLIPFGKTYLWLTVQIMNALGGQIVGYAGIGGALTLAYVMQELAKGLFTVIIFEALNLGVAGLMGLTEAKGFWNKAKLLLITVMNALVAACLAPLPLNYIFSQFGSLENIISGIISFLLSGILLGGGIAFFLFLKNLTIGVAVCYVLMKFVLMSTVRLSVSYLCILLILLGIQNGLFGLIVSGSSGLLGIALLLGGIELMIDSVFK